MPNLFALVALLGWIPISLAFFCWLPISRAVSVAVVFGWLLLPIAKYQLPGIPDFGKGTAILMGTAIGMLFHRDLSQVLREFRLSWIDIFPVMLSAGAIVTSSLNGLGIWDGVASSIETLCIWTGPYFIGRLTYRSFDAALELVKTIVIGGLLYVPLCLFEIRMSPQLHQIVYGFKHNWNVLRFGGYRPSVFLLEGLELGLWMTATSIAAIILWRQGRKVRILGCPTGALIATLLATTVLCKSTGALVLLIGGLGCWFLARLFGSRLPLLMLIVISIVYILSRASGFYDGAALVRFVDHYISDERASSLDTRLTNEDLLGARAFLRPWFGWGGFGRSLVYNDWGKEISIPDGYWIILLGSRGVVGLLGAFALLLVPCFAAVYRCGPDVCRCKRFTPDAALTVVVSVFAIDCLLNAFPSPVYMLCAGALCSLANCASMRGATPVSLGSISPIYPTRLRKLWPPANSEKPIYLKS